MISKDVFFWCDDWWIENEMAWLILGEEQILCEYSFISKKLQILDRIPIKYGCEARSYSRCVKYNSNIICIPDKGKFILVFSIVKKTWKSIEVKSNSNDRITGIHFNILENNLFFYAKGLGQIIEFDMNLLQITKCINIPYNVNEELEFGVFISNMFYVLACSQNQSYVYKCNVYTSEIERYIVPCKNDMLSTICNAYDKFIISGKTKNLYIWNNLNTAERLTNIFPSDFGEYNYVQDDEKIVDKELEKYRERTFYCMVLVNELIWFIPFQTNKILFLNNENIIKEFSVANEEETKSSLINNQFRHKYLLQYVKQDRYIGLYSTKNEYILEIDAKKMDYRILQFEFDDSLLEALGGKTFYDNKKIDKFFYNKRLSYKHGYFKEQKKQVGEKIYGLIKDNQ